MTTAPAERPQQERKPRPVKPPPDKRRKAPVREPSRRSGPVGDPPPDQPGKWTRQ